MLFVVCDGLSAVAVQRHAADIAAIASSRPCVPPVRSRRSSSPRRGVWRWATTSAARWAPRRLPCLIGERPGLSAADSLGIYLTWQPRPGRTDAERNCISNIRPAGLPVAQAAAKLLWLIEAMRRLRLTGVALKDDQPASLAGARQCHG